jgi:hypothetical protein
MCCARSLSGSGSGGGGGTVTGGSGWKIWNSGTSVWSDAPYQTVDFEKMFGTVLALDDVTFVSIPNAPIKGSFYVVINIVGATFPSVAVVLRKEDATGTDFGMGVVATSPDVGVLVGLFEFQWAAGVGPSVRVTTPAAANNYTIMIYGSSSP